MCEKFTNDRLRNDRSLGDGKSDNNKKKKKKKKKKKNKNKNKNKNNNNNNNNNKRNSSSGACLRRSRCHEFPPSRSVLSASLHSRQSKIHRSQVGIHGSEPGLLWTTNPPSPVVRWARCAGLESSVMILPEVGAVEMSNEGQTATADSV